MTSTNVLENQRVLKHATAATTRAVVPGASHAPPGLRTGCPAARSGFRAAGSRGSGRERAALCFLLASRGVCFGSCGGWWAGGLRCLRSGDGGWRLARLLDAFRMVWARVMVSADGGGARDGSGPLHTYATPAGSGLPGSCAACAAHLVGRCVASEVAGENRRAGERQACGEPRDSAPCDPRARAAIRSVDWEANMQTQPATPPARRENQCPLGRVHGYRVLILVAEVIPLLDLASINRRVGGRTAWSRIFAHLVIDREHARTANDFHSRPQEDLRTASFC